MTPDTLVADVYKTLEARDGDPADLDSICQAFADECYGFMMNALTEDEQDRSSLRLSAIGKPARQLWHTVNGTKSAKLTGPTYIKFLYGHLVEAMVLALVKASGHTVTEQQKECWVAGVKGHQDCRIDGVLCDVKSASSFGFKKFKYNTLHKDDPFGYIAQLKGYAHQEGDTAYGWLAMDKQNGTLAWLQYDEKDTGAPYHDAVDWDVEEHVNALKKLVAGPSPSVCYDPVPDGKAGNEKLATGCVYCDFRAECWPNAQAYKYSSGQKWLTTVVKEPRVDKVLPDGF